MVESVKMIKRVIFVIADTLRAKNVGIYGNRPSPTPNIDALGQRGITFTNAYATITCTDPSISAIMTGKCPLSAGIINHGGHVTEEEEIHLKNISFLPEIFKAHGYKTYAVDWLGRWHKRGYDYYSGKIVKDSDPPDLLNRWSWVPLPLAIRIIDKITIRYLKREFFVRAYYAFSPKPKIPYDTAEVVINKAIRLLQNNKEKNLFLYLHLWEAHFPHTVSKGLSSYLTHTVEDTYNSEINYLDRQVRRLIDYLDQTKQLDDSLIIFTSDHGENLHEHDIPFNHENLYDDITKVPLILRHKSLRPQKIDALVQHVDILPTILDMLGIPLSQKDFDGSSLMPLISGKKKQVRDFAYFEDITYRKLPFPPQTRRRGIRVGDYKYIETLTGKNEELYQVMPKENLRVSKEELYNLKKNPSEKENLIKKKPAAAKLLREKLHKIISQLNMKRLRNNPGLHKKVEKSLQVIRKAARQFNNKEIALAWTGGKDSTALLHLARLAFDGKLPFRVLFNDSTMEFEEIYQFIDKVSKLWNIKVLTIKHSDKELREFHKTPDHQKKKELSRLMKITAINTALKKYKLKALMAAIRWDEHESRSKEKYFSPRADHMRIHPVLHFTEKDIWQYIRHFGVPYVDLYSKGYRSLGEKPFTKKATAGGGERSGRERDKEQLMKRLRKLGYW